MNPDRQIDPMSSLVRNALDRLDSLRDREVKPRSESYIAFVMFTLGVTGLTLLWVVNLDSSPFDPEIVGTLKDVDPDLTTTTAESWKLAFVSTLSLATGISAGGAAMALHAALETRETWTERPWGRERLARNRDVRLVRRVDWLPAVLAVVAGAFVVLGLRFWNPASFNVQHSLYGDELMRTLAIPLVLTGISATVTIALGHHVAHRDDVSLAHLLNANWVSSRMFAIFAATLSLGLLAISARWKMGEHLAGGQAVPGIFLG